MLKLTMIDCLKNNCFVTLVNLHVLTKFVVYYYNYFTRAQVVIIVVVILTSDISCKLADSTIGQGYIIVYV